MEKEKPRQDRDSESSESSEMIQPRKVNRRNRNDWMDSCDVFALNQMENIKSDTNMSSTKRIGLQESLNETVHVEKRN